MKLLKVLCSSPISFKSYKHTKFWKCWTNLSAKIVQREMLDPNFQFNLFNYQILTKSQQLFIYKNFEWNSWTNLFLWNILLILSGIYINKITMNSTLNHFIFSVCTLVNRQRNAIPIILQIIKYILLFILLLFYYCLLYSYHLLSLKNMLP